MPLDEMGGCLAALIRVIGGMLELFATTSGWSDVLGFIGRWFVKLITLGRVDLDAESWTAILIGFGVFVGLITLLALQ